MPRKGRCLRFMASGYRKRSMCDACISVRRDYPNESVRLTPYQTNSKCFHDTFCIFQDNSFFYKKQFLFLLTSKICFFFFMFLKKINAVQPVRSSTFAAEKNQDCTVAAEAYASMLHIPFCMHKSEESSVFHGISQPAALYTERMTARAFSYHRNISVIRPQAC